MRNEEYNESVKELMDNEPEPFDGEEMTEEELDELYNSLMDEATNQNAITKAARKAEEEREYNAAIEFGERVPF